MTEFEVGMRVKAFFDGRWWRLVLLSRTTNGFNDWRCREEDGVIDVWGEHRFEIISPLEQLAEAAE